MTALIKATQEGRLHADIRVVLSNKADAIGLEYARSCGVPTLVMSHKDYASRSEYDCALVAELQSRGVQYIALAGFMRILTSDFLGPYQGRVINIHPALLPSFPGIHAQKQALDYGVKVTGCTVHFVDEGTDTGAVIAQKTVPVLDDDDEDSLSARILTEENKLYAEALEEVLRGRVTIHGRKTVHRH